LGSFHTILLTAILLCRLFDSLNHRHIRRLQNGECTVQLGFILSDLLTNLERVSDHCSNIAVAQIETAQSLYQAHEYLNALKSAGDASFQSAFENYCRQYAI